MRLEGKTALVTGGGTGIGAAITERFVAEGAKVCIAGRRKERLEQEAAACPAGSVLACPGDVSVYDDVKRMVASTVDFGGRIDILVNNAAADVYGVITELEPEDWQQVMNVNLYGAIRCIQAVLPRMRARGSGCIVNISSVVGRMCQNLTAADRDLAPLTPDLEAVIQVEDYDPFPVDVGALWGPAPAMPCLEPVPTERFVAYEHRKLYGHNGVHALLGVLGRARGYTYFYEAGQDAELDALGRQAMWEEVGAALVRAHSEHFTAASMDAFAANLYARLVNPVFADEIERGARDTLRMIRPEDGRLAVAALFVAAQGIEPWAMCQGVAAALRDNGLGMEGIAEVLGEAEEGAAEVVRTLVTREMMNDPDLR